MNNIVQFHSREEHHGISLRMLDLSFFVGVVSTFVLPPIIFCSYFGSIGIVTLTAAAVIGIGIGIKSYRNGPQPMPACIPDAVSESTAEAEFRLAA